MNGLSLYSSSRLIASFALAALLSACGGGGGSSNNAPGGGGGSGTTPPFGLTQRASLATFNLPSSNGGSSTFTLTSAYPGLSFSASIFAAPVPGENRLIVVEQGGRVLAFVDDPGTSVSREILNLSGQIIFAGEQGLLGFAFDPDFQQNRYVYVHYTAPSSNPAQTSVISRFTWDAGLDRIPLSSERILLENPQTFTNHNGGMLAFGPDDMLYIAFGDSGSSGDPNNEAQDLSTLHGNVLRIDVHPADPGDPYDIPADNPYLSTAGARPEIWANGLRNPFRFSFDSQTGTLWLGDVGQGSREEIDIIERGANYGWRVLEGTERFNDNGNSLPDSAFTPPVFDYPHSEGRSVIGGYVYRGNAFASLFGKYVYGDFVSGTIWALTWDGSQVIQRETLASTANPASFAEKANGELLVVPINGNLLAFQENGGTGSLPALLSDTGLFTDLTTLTPASGLVEYELQIPFYSDGASKRRWVGVPDGSRINFSADQWILPVGSVVVKHFEISTPTGVRRLETRVLINTSGGWQGFTYRWNNNATDADLLLQRETETLTVLRNGMSVQQTYEYPSRTDCFVCHTDAANTTLGLRTVQLNRDFNYAGTLDNQLRSFNNIALFNTNIGDADSYDAFPAATDSNADLNLRARSYLDVNCAHCHQPGSSGTTDLDLRFAVSDNAMNAIGVAPARGDLGIANALVIAAGEKERSILWQRINRRGAEQMPPLGSHVIDEEGVSLLGNWIDSL